MVFTLSASGGMTILWTPSTTMPVAEPQSLSLSNLVCNTLSDFPCSFIASRMMSAVSVARFKSLESTASKSTAQSSRAASLACSRPTSVNVPGMHP